MENGLKGRRKEEEKINEIAKNGLKQEVERLKDIWCGT